MAIFVTLIKRTRFLFLGVSLLHYVCVHIHFLFKSFCVQCFLLTENTHMSYFLFFFCFYFSSVQVDDYSKRKGMKVEEVERWLAPILGYDAEEGV